MGFQIKEGNQGNVVIQSDGPGDHVRLVSTVATPSAALGLIVTGTATMAGTLQTMGNVGVGVAAAPNNGIAYGGVLAGNAGTALSLNYTGAPSANELVGTRYVWNTPSMGTITRVVAITIGITSSQGASSAIGSYVGFHQDTINFPGTVSRTWYGQNTQAPSFSGVAPSGVFGIQVDDVASLGSFGGANLVVGAVPTGAGWNIYGNSTLSNAFGGPLSVNTMAPPAANSLTLAGHLQSFGTVINATNGAASSAINSAIGNDLAGRVSFQTTTTTGGAQIIHVFSTAFPTNPYPIVNGAGNPSFQASFPTVTVSTNSMTISLAITPTLGGSVGYFFHVIG